MDGQHAYTGSMQPLPPAAPHGEPRIARFNRWAAALALVLGNILMMFLILTLVWALNTLGGIASRINTDTTTPGPIVTGCPFGDDQCGG